MVSSNGDAITASSGTVRTAQVSAVAAQSGAVAMARPSGAHAASTTAAAIRASAIGAARGIRAVIRVSAISAALGVARTACLSAVNAASTTAAAIRASASSVALRVAQMACVSAAVLALAVAATAAAPGATSDADGRVQVPLTSGWRFKQAAGLTGVEAPQFDDASWQQVTVPHTWNRIGNEGYERSPNSNHIQGTGWYRLRFHSVPAKDARYFLQFDGVSTVADVWLNGHYLGKHEGAFARFRFDATAAMSSAGDNVLVVKADNTRPAPGTPTENIPPLSGDFFMFGGIYRKAALIITHSAHIDLMDFGGPGIYTRTSEIRPDSATVQVTARVTNNDPKPQRLRVETEILGADNEAVASNTSDAGPVAPGAVSVIQSNLNIANPHLWNGVSDPYLYHTVVTLRSPKGVVLDRVTQPVGLRTIKFDPDKGFFLNGEHHYLKGVAIHQDRPVEGWAVSDADQDEDFAIAADLGANAARLAHYQHDQRSYDIADAKGIIIWAEIPLVNKVSYDGTPANAAFSANARQQLLELIQQNRNHPSVALWSIANEIDLTPTQVKGPSHPAPLLKELNALAKSQDPDRPTTFADCCEVAIPPHVGDPANLRDPIVGIADTVGYNRYFGWYIGHFADFGTMLDQAHARHPQTPISVSEYGAGAALTQHSDDPNGGPINPHGRPHPEEYQNLYHEASWAALHQRPYLWGSFIWNLFDFASDSRREGDLTDINEKGLVSYDRKVRKDAFYFYRANWSSQPTLHLVGRRYIDRPYGVLDVKAYSNATQVHLSLNGKDVGAASCADGVCLWRAVHLAPGANELRATADIGGATVSDSLQWTFAGKPNEVRIKAGDLTGYVTADHQRYGSDMYFTGGEGKGVNPPDTAPEKQIHVDAADPRLFDSYRVGQFSYRVPVPDGKYKITLRFAEPTASAVGERVFDVSVNGKRLLKQVDIFATAGGKLKGIERTIQSPARDGALLIEFVPGKGDPVVSSLAITPVGNSAR